MKVYIVLHYIDSEAEVLGVFKSYDSAVKCAQDYSINYFDSCFYKVENKNPCWLVDGDMALEITTEELKD